MKHQLKVEPLGMIFLLMTAGVAEISQFVGFLMAVCTINILLKPAEGTKFIAYPQLRVTPNTTNLLNSIPSLNPRIENKNLQELNQSKAK